MNIVKKWLPTALLAVAGILALALGFAAAFGDITLVDKNAGSVTLTMGEAYKDLYPSVKNVGLIGSHIGMAHVGGIITGVLGLGSLAAAGFVGYKTQIGDFDGDKRVLIASIVTFVVLFTLAVAAIACNSDLNDLIWWTKQILKSKNINFNNH